MKNSFYVINSRGEKESFSFKKILRSARRVGASRNLAQRIADTVKREAYPGIRTSEIFKKVKKLLYQETPKSALKFNLKEGMKRLGPTGFLFEKYIGEIFSRQDFEIKLNQHLRGDCLRYEIDFLAQKGNLFYVGECKYRNLPGGLVHSNIALANYARFLDIEKGNFFKRKTSRDFSVKSILVTNTKFTQRTIKYSNYVNVELLGWNYPRNRGLEFLIDDNKLYPITILPSFKKCFSYVFIQRRLMLAEDILGLNIEKFAQETKITKSYLKLLASEAKILLES